MGTRAGEQSHIGAKGAQLHSSNTDAVAVATVRSKGPGARCQVPGPRGEEGEVHDYCRSYYYQLPSFSCPLAISLIYIRPPSPAALSPYPTTLSLSPITFQPSSLIARYFLSPIRETRPTHSLRRISYSFSSSN